jgi:hypothetical protein
MAMMMTEVGEPRKMEESDGRSTENVLGRFALAWFLLNDSIHKRAIMWRSKLLGSTKNDMMSVWIAKVEARSIADSNGSEHEEAQKQKIEGYLVGSTKEGGGEIAALVVLYSRAQ